MSYRTFETEHEVEQFLRGLGFIHAPEWGWYKDHERANVCVGAGVYHVTIRRGMDRFFHS